MTTTPTSGAADLPEALRRSMAADGKTELFNLPGYPLMVRAVDFNRLHTQSEMRRVALLDEMQKAALAAGQATAAQAVVQDDLITLRKPTTIAEMLWLLKLAHLVISDVDKTLEEAFAPAQPAAQHGAAYAEMTEKYYLAGGEVPTWDVDQMRAFADATHMLRASHGEAPAGAAEEIDKALNVYAQAFAARVNGWTRQNGDDLPGARSALFAAIHAYARASTRPATAPHADSVLGDAARLDWLLLRVSGAEFRHE